MPACEYGLAMIPMAPKKSSETFFALAVMNTTIVL